MKKKILSILLATVVATSVLAGCGNQSGGNSNGAKAPETETDNSETENSDQTEEPESDPGAAAGEIVYWSFTDSANNLIEEFNKVYPDIKVDLHVFGGDEYKTKILTALQNGSGVPDIFDLEEGYMYDFLDSDLIQDLSYINLEELVKDAYPFQNAGMKDSSGKYKTLIFQSSPVGMWYLRDAAEEWLGTSDAAEISAMIPDWDTMLAVAKDVYEKSNGEVYLWPNMGEIIKVDSFSYPSLVQDGKLVIADEWIQMLEDLRKINDSEYNAKLDSWSSEWAAAWNDGKLIFRVMPSWDFFTDWDKNTGNVGICPAPRASSEGNTGICVYANSEKKDIAGTFLSFIASDEFQKINLDSYNQVPVSKKVCDEMAEGYSNEKFGGQNILATYSEICNAIPAVTPDKYTRAVINQFQKAATNGIKDGQDNDQIIAEFKKLVADQYPEIIIE